MVLKTEYTEKNGRPIIHVFRRRGRTKTHDVITDFEPYFYVAKEERIADNRIIRTEEGHKDLFGKQIKKIVVSLPRDVSDLRNRFVKTYEDNIIFGTRFQIDRLETMDDGDEIRICYLDIETEDKGSFPDITKAVVPIYCITCFDSYTKTYTSFISLCKTASHQMLPSPKQNAELRFFDREEEMLNAFVEYAQEKDFDMFTGWNVENFDMKYIINRMKTLRLVYEKLSPLDVVYAHEDVTIKGRIVFDMCDAYRKIKSRTLERNSLDVIAMEELGEGKIKTGRKIWELWENDLSKLIEYNTKDVELVWRIAEQTKIIECFRAVQLLSFCDFKDYFTNSVAIHCYLLRKCRGRCALPGKQKTIEEKTLKGAVVFEPTKGLHENVLSFDLKSMYPSLILSGNMSPETIDKDGEIRFKFCNFTNKKQGLLGEVILELLELRRQYTQKMNDVTDETERVTYYSLQYSTKVLVNSIYGVMGMPSFCLYRPEIANNITWMGREVVLFSKKILEEKGKEVLYGDTDSIFLKSDNRMLDEMIEEGNEIERMLNEKYKEFLKVIGAESRLKIQFKLIYEKIMFVVRKGDTKGAKKKYSGIVVWNEGREERKMSYVGFEGVRADNAKITRDVQRMVLEMAFSGRSQEEIERYLRGEIEKMKDYDYEYIGIPQEIKQLKYKTNLPKVRGTKMAEKIFGRGFKIGDKPLMLYIKNVNSDVICFEKGIKVPSDIKIDLEKMADSVVIKKVESIFESMGWKLFSTQKGLEDWL